MNTEIPFFLPLAPIPVSRMESTGEQRAIIPDGFVDDDVIASLLSPIGDRRVTAIHSDLVLASDVDDFAGWAVQHYSPFRIIAEQQEYEAPSPKEDAAIKEPDLEKSHRGGHRWWIVTGTVISSALILSLLFSSLAVHGETNSPFSRFMKRLEQVQSWLGSMAP